VVNFVFFDVKSYFVLKARYWDDPYTFKPSRFLGDWPRDAFLPFSAGENLFPILIREVMVLTLFQGLEHASAESWSFNIYVIHMWRIDMRTFIRFAETEAVAVLTTLLLHYQVEVKEEPQFAMETFEERKARVLMSSVPLTVK
jgi:hypothetical protein